MALCALYFPSYLIFALHVQDQVQFAELGPLAAVVANYSAYPGFPRVNLVYRDVSPAGLFPEPCKKTDYLHPDYPQFGIFMLIYRCASVALLHFAVMRLCVALLDARSYSQHRILWNAFHVHRPAEHSAAFYSQRASGRLFLPISLDHAARSVFRVHVRRQNTVLSYAAALDVVFAIDWHADGAARNAFAVSVPLERGQAEALDRRGKQIDRLVCATRCKLTCSRTTHNSTTGIFAIAGWCLGADWCLHS